MNDGFRERYDDDAMESVVDFVRKRKHGKLISHRLSSSIFATSLRSWYGRVRQKRARQDARIELSIRATRSDTTRRGAISHSQLLNFVATCCRASRRVVSLGLATYCEPGLRICILIFQHTSMSSIQRGVSLQICWGSCT